MNDELIVRLRPLADGYAKRKSGRVVEPIDAGGSAAVYIAEKPEGRFALKVYAPELLEGKNGAAELKRIELQRKLIGHSCTYLVQLYDVHVDENGCFVEMEYVPWPTLKKILPQLPNAMVQQLIGQLVEACRFLESHNIVHRDIKPENILVSPDFMELRLIDLGVVRGTDASESTGDATDHGHRRPFIATAQYSSPEYLFRLVAPSADMWRALTFYQIGGVLHDMLVKRPLFAEAARTENKHVVSMSVFRETPILSDAAPELSSLAALAAHCLTKDPDFRLRLVSWERFVPTALSGAERLRAMNAQAMANGQARRAQELSLRQHQEARELCVRNTHERVRDALQEMGGQAYKASSYVKGATSANFELRVPSGAELNLCLTFTWGDDPLPLRAWVTLSAGLNAGTEMGTNREAAVAEIDASSPLDTLVDAALDRIGHVVASSMDQITMGRLPGDSSGRGDLIELSGLA